MSGGTKKYSTTTSAAKLEGEPEVRGVVSSARGISGSSPVTSPG